MDSDKEKRQTLFEGTVVVMPKPKKNSKLTESKWKTRRWEKNKAFQGNLNFVTLSHLPTSQLMKTICKVRLYYPCCSACSLHLVVFNNLSIEAPPLKDSLKSQLAL